MLDVNKHIMLEHFKHIMLFVGYYGNFHPKCAFADHFRAAGNT
jgi:hypothetical protein